MIIYKTGVYYDDCDDWLEKPSHTQTWTNFQHHFNAAHPKAKRKQRTTLSEGYHGVNAAITSQTAMQAENEATTEAMANMATAMSADRTTMGQLTTAIADLTIQLSARDSEIASLKSRLREGNTTNNNNRRELTWVNGKHRRDRGGYCWAHGFLVAPNGHNSNNCTSPTDGHKKCTTRDNTMGGNEYRKPCT